MIFILWNFNANGCLCTWAEKADSSSPHPKIGFRELVDFFFSGSSGSSGSLFENPEACPSCFYETKMVVENMGRWSAKLRKLQESRSIVTTRTGWKAFGILLRSEISVSRCFESATRKKAWKWLLSWKSIVPPLNKSPDLHNPYTWLFSHGGNTCQWSFAPILPMEKCPVVCSRRWLSSLPDWSCLCYRYRP